MGLVLQKSMAPADGRPCEGWPLDAILGGGRKLQAMYRWCVDAHIGFSLGSVFVQFGSILVQLVKFSNQL